MARSTKPGQLRINLSPVTSTLVLALWRWRQHWFLLLMTGLGIVAAVMIVCAVPLFSEVMLTAGLRNTLTATPRSSEMTLAVDTAGLSSAGVDEISHLVTPVLPQFLRNYLSGQPEREIRTTNFNFISPQPPDRGDQAVLGAFSMREAASHMALVQGRLPQITSQDVEVAITPETAQSLHVGVGSVITIQLAYFTQPAVLGIASGKLVQGGTLQPLKLHVVGLFNVKAGDPFWHDEDFKPIVPDQGPIYFPIFLLLAAVLLFMRFFPFLLRLSSNIAMRVRGAAPMLALAQMARAPRQAVRMTLLLALATAFTIFTLVFVASQSQRGLDIAAYQTGADFSGDFRLNANILPLSQETALYKHIPGITSATVGYIGDGTVVEGLSALTAPNLPIQIRAVDPSTFAQTMIWTSTDSSQSLSSLTAQLATQRATAIRTTTVPAIVDAYTWDRLGLHVGASFSVNNSSTPGDNLHYIAIAEVQHIPTITDSFAGGVLVDYASLAAVQKQVNRTYISLNHVWLQTRDDPAALASVRTALGAGNLRLENLYDRRELADTLHSDPCF